MNRSSGHEDSVEDLTTDQNASGNFIQSTADHSGQSHTQLVLQIRFCFISSAFLLGFLGNIMTLVVMKHTKAPQTTKIILACLALSDNFALISKYLSYVFEKMMSYNAIATSAWLCKYNIFCSFLFPPFSNWMVAMLSVERASAVTFPIHLKKIFTPRKIGTIVTIIFFLYVIWTCFAVHDFNIVSFLDNKGHFLATMCFPRNYLVIIQCISGLCDFGLPLLIVLTCNIVIVSSLAWFRKQALPFTKSSKSREPRLILTTCVVSLAFLVFSTPVILYYTVGKAVLEEQVFVNSNNPYRIAVDCISMVNFAVNFYLYVVFIKSYRATLRMMFGKLRFKCGEDPSGIEVRGTSQIETVSSQ